MGSSNSFIVNAYSAATARDTLRCGVSVGRCEMLDKQMVEIMNKYYLRAGSPTDSADKWREETTLLYEGTFSYNGFYIVLMKYMYDGPKLLVYPTLRSESSCKWFLELLLSMGALEAR